MKVFRSLQEKAQKATTTTQGITPRAVIIGLLLVSFLCTVTPYTDLVMGGTLLASDHLPVGVIGIFFVLMAIINPILRALPLKKPFTSAELVTIYVMMLVAAGIPSFGLTAYLFPMITAPYYFATAENKWESTIFQYIPRWFAPTQKSVIKPFYEGLKPWETIPWGAWLKPLVGWSIFIFALYLVTVCMERIEAVNDGWYCNSDPNQLVLKESVAPRSSLITSHFER
jgi:hypothetical protein